jgi:hypothetical protein
MAGDWIKLQKDTPDKPEVLAMAARLGIDSDAVLGKLVRVWCWFDTHTTNGNASCVTFSYVDRISGVTGFADQMQLVGWLDQSGLDLVLPNFDYHTGDTAKTRALGKKRAEKQRNNANSNDHSVTKSLPEKRREEKRSSVANATGDKPPKVTDPNEIIFGYGLPMLTTAGTPEKQARSFLGGLRKHHGDEALIDKLRECAKAKPLQPLEWLAAALPPVGAAKPSKHAGFEKLNYREGIADDGTFA